MHLLSVFLLSAPQMRPLKLFVNQDYHLHLPPLISRSLLICHQRCVHASRARTSWEVLRTPGRNLYSSLLTSVIDESDAAYSKMNRNCIKLHRRLNSPQRLRSERRRQLTFSKLSPTFFQYFFALACGAVNQSPSRPPQLVSSEVCVCVGPRRRV